MIGVSNYFEAGLYADVEVALFDVPGADYPEDSVLAGDQQLIAMPHEETNGNEAYNFITSGGTADGPYFVTDEDASSGPVVAPAEITVTEGGGESAALFAQRDASLPAGFIASEPTPVTSVNGNPDSFWAALPYTLYADDGAGGTSEVDLRFSYNYGELAVEFASAQEVALSNLGGEYSVKVVVIPPDEEAAGDGDGGDGVGGEASARTRDFETYKQAARALGLPPLTDEAGWQSP